jgi:hypothetical protein
MAGVRLLWRREHFGRRRGPFLTDEIDEMVHAGASVTRERVTDRALLARRSEMSDRLPEPRHLEEWLVSA